MAWTKDISHWYRLLYNLKKIYLRKDDIIMKSNFKKNIINSLLLAIGFILHQVAPPIFFGMKPDLSLTMVFIIIILNEDYKTTLIVGIIAGILSALTTTFPGGQPANVIDKIITSNVIYLALLPFRNKLNNQIKIIIFTAIGTVLSGTVFLTAASILVGLPQSFTAMFIAVVLPAALVNTVTAIILFNAIQISLKHAKVTL